MIWTNRVAALILLGFVAYVWPMTERFPGTASAFPRVVLATIGVLAALMLLRTLFARIELTTDGEGSREPRALVMPLLAITATAGAVWLMRYVAFFPAAGLLGLVLLVVLQVRNWVPYVASYAGMLLFVYVVFHLILGVPLLSTRLFGG